MLFNWAMLGIMLAAAVVSATVVLAVSAAPAEIFDVLSAPHVAANIGNIAHAMFEMVEKAARAVDTVHDGVETAWNMMATRFSPFMICGPITFLYHESVYFLCYVPWLILDAMPSMHKYKIQPDKVNDLPQQMRCLRQLIFSHIFIQFPMMLTFHLVVDLFGFQIAGPLPAFSQLLWQIPAFLVIEDFYFYWMHRFLHWKKIYKYVHKVHHEHKSPFGITAEYAHPIETVVLGLGTLLGPLLLCRHLFTLWVYLGVRLWETVEDHSGYDVPFNPTNLIPFWGGPVHHDFHHKTFDGPYSSIFTYCDYLFGTDKKWREHQRKLRVRGEESVFYPAVFRGAPNMKAVEAAAQGEAKKAN